jgi:biotin carboxyl carrier protein
MKAYKYKIDGKEYSVEICNVENNMADVSVNGETFKVEIETETINEMKTSHVNSTAKKENVESRASETSSAIINEANAVKAPLPGVITDIKVNVGDTVKVGDTVIVLEAMKMANNLEAEKDGKVTAICVKVGESVMEDTSLVVIE